MEILEINLEDIAIDFDLRVDPKFYSFSVKNQFDLISDTKYPRVRLKDLLKPEYVVFNYEEHVIYKGLPTSAEYFDEDGEILKYLPVTKRCSSRTDKI